MVTSAAPEPKAPHTPDDLVVALYECVATARIVGERLAAMQREGRVPAFPDLRGEEAAIVGAAAALRPTDVIFGGDLCAAIARGVPFAVYAHHLFASASAPSRGRAPAERFSSRAARIAPPGGVLGAHVAHAVGYAWAAKSRGEDVVALASFTAAATNASDFHTALNFAGVFKAPAIFFFRRPESAPSLAGKATAYGIASATVDGGDVFAVVDAMRAALASRAPALIEAVTDERDPILRARRAAEARGVWSDAKQAELEAAVARDLDAAVAAAEAAPPPARTDLFEHVFAAPPWHLREQRGK